MERVKSLETVIGMKGGNEDTSYARVSLFSQFKMIQVIKPILEREIPQYLKLHKLIKGGDAVFRIADFGCATGINTLIVADTIVRAVQTTCSSQCMELPEFQVYFADLPSNDFNSLLRSLPPHEQLAEQQEDQRGFAEPPATRSYFAAMVCGSFYKRLFPPKTLHFCHSSSSLHWLSQIWMPDNEVVALPICIEWEVAQSGLMSFRAAIMLCGGEFLAGRIIGESISLEVEDFKALVPESVVDRNSPAWNGGAIYISRDEVGAAYLSQFQKDFSAFLAARGEEMIPGGGMFICLTGRNSEDIKEQSAIGHISHHMEAAFQELINEGVIEKETVESFNLPLFCPNVEELESIVKMENSFEIAGSVKLFSGFHLHPISEVRKGDEEMFGRMVTNNYRAAFENLVRAQLGSDVLTNEFFWRIEKKATAKCQEYVHHRGDQLGAFLVRK